MASGDLLAAAAFFAEVAVAIEHSKHVGLEKAAVIVEDAAKRAIGDPNNGYGWAPLAESTLARKAGNTPLLETGALQASVSHVVAGNEAQIGSNEDTAVWQILGTTKGIPPRDFLTPSVTHNEDKITEAIGQAFHAALTGRGLP